MHREMGVWRKPNLIQLLFFLSGRGLRDIFGKVAPCRTRAWQFNAILKLVTSYSSDVCGAESVGITAKVLGVIDFFLFEHFCIERSMQETTSF